MPEDSFTFYTAEEYWLDLQQRIDATSKNGRIAMMVMDLNPDAPLMRAVFNKLIAAAERGVEVWLGVDAHTFLFNHATRSLSSYWLTNDLERLPPALSAKFRLLKQLDTYPSGHTAIINQPAHILSNPVAGRSHIKATVVDGYTYVGGCNFQNPEWVDIMVGWQNETTADYLFEFMSDTVQQHSTRAVMRGVDRTLELAPNTNLYLDAGKPGQSTILARALNLIDSAERTIFMTCQFFPNAVTARHLAAAHARGVDIELIYAHPTMQGTVGGIGQHLSILIERTRIPAILFRGILPAEGPSLHAKVLCTDKGAIIGSHNYVRAGVRLGTAEIAIASHDPLFSRQAVATIKRSLTAL